MMKAYLAASLLAWCFLGQSLVRAQDDQDSANKGPTPPFVGHPSGNFHLIKKYEYAVLPVDPGVPDDVKQSILAFRARLPKLIQDEIIGYGSVTEETYMFTPSWAATTQQWRYPPYVFDTVPGATTPASYQTISSYEAGKLGKVGTSFPELDWIGLENYKGPQLCQGKKCYHYDSGTATAWIDVATRLPLFYKSAQMQITYEYVAPPDEPLQLPVSVLETLKKLKASASPQPQ